MGSEGPSAFSNQGEFCCAPAASGKSVPQFLLLGPQLVGPGAPPRLCSKGTCEAGEGTRVCGVKAAASAPVTPPTLHRNSSTSTGRGSGAGGPARAVTAGGGRPLQSIPACSFPALASLRGTQRPPEALWAARRAGTPTPFHEDPELILREAQCWLCGAQTPELCGGLWGPGTPAAPHVFPANPVKPSLCPYAGSPGRW